MERFIRELQNYHILSLRQQSNASLLIDISKKFHKKAQISCENSTIESDRTIILESGHQPNFLPHAGTWKKAFLLANLQKKLMMNGNTTIAFFGFPDRNLSTARLLSRNQIPALNKKGVEAIGFRIDDADRLKSFCTTKKPSSDTWQNEIHKIKKFYTEISNKFPDKKILSKTQLNQIFEIMWKSYDLAGNFAELNGYIFSKICHEILNLNLLFFFYSDMQKERLFIDESKKIFQNVRAFNQIYNRVIEEKRLDIPPVNESHVPFWYHCECGGKINLFIDDSFSCKGTCPVCKKEYHLFFDTGFKNLQEYYDKMDYNAVSRNIVMSEGLGVTLFISGMGGSLQYGAIADQISHELTFNYPISLSWQSKDYYLGMTHAQAIQEFKKIFLLPSRALLDPALNEMICQHVHMISQKLSDAQKKNEDLRVINLLVGMRNHSKNWPLISQKIFSNTPSIIDIFANHDFRLIIDLWECAINNAEITNNSSPYLIKADINYIKDLIDDIKPEEMPLVYRKIRGLEVE